MNLHWSSMGKTCSSYCTSTDLPFDLRTSSSFLLAIGQVTRVRERAVNYNQGIFHLLSEYMSGKVISGALLIPQRWNVTDSVAQASLDLHEYNRDQTEILRLQCQRPAGLYYIFFPADENDVLGEMNGLVPSEFFLEYCCLQKLWLAASASLLGSLSWKNKEWVVWEQHFWHLSAICVISFS